MSWEKNTIIVSNIDSVVNTLENLNTSYKLITLGFVIGLGINDCEMYQGDSKEYPIRKLEYKNIVLIEQMQRTSDCDMNDFLVSIKYKKGTNPKEENWKLEKWIDKEEI